MPPDLDESPSGDEGSLFWQAAGAVWRHRWLVAVLTVLGALASIGVSLWLPNWYAAEARVMLPGSGGSSMSALIESVAPGASGLLGGGDGGDYTRYLAILTSRTAMEEIVDAYDLVRVYGTENRPDPGAAAVGMLRRNVSFDVNIEYNYLGLSVLDRDPRRAANIANAFVVLLNRRNTGLSSDAAREQRVFVERRLREADAALDSARAAMQGMQERYGVTEPAMQGEALMASVAAASQAVAEAEVRYEALRTEFAEDAPETRAARAALDAARSQLAGLTAGRSAVFPVPLAGLPNVARQYGQLEQEMMIQARIIEFVRPMYEQAMFDERRQTSAVQVIDPAVPPTRKARPKRSQIVVASTVSSLVLALMLAVGLDLARRRSPQLSARIRRAAA